MKKPPARRDPPERKELTRIMRQCHTIDPVFDSSSEILILGSFPSVRSRADQFFYAHPQNRFWRVLAGICRAELPVTIDEKRSLLLANHIALWDVIQSCEITGSGDASIRGAQANDLWPLLAASNIRAIFTNGRTADSLYARLIEPQLHRKAVCLPSTSPANAAYTMDRLLSAWQAVAETLASGQTPAGLP